MIVVNRPISANGYTYMHNVCIGFEKTDINKKGQLVVGTGIDEIDIDEKYMDFEAEVEEIILPKNLEKVSKNAFRNIKAKCVNIPKKLNLDTEYIFNDALETLKISGGTVNSVFIKDYYPKLNKIIIEEGELLVSCCTPIHNHIKSLEFSENCKNAFVDLGAFSSLDEIKFPEKFKPNIRFKMHYSTSTLMLNTLSNVNLIQLLQYCPEAYLNIYQETCDDIFRYNAKNAITNGMASRQQAQFFKDVSGDLALLKSIKEKMKKDEDFHLSPQAKFLNAMSEFHKE